MDLTKTDRAIITAQDQITLPKEARAILNVSAGDQVAFIYEDEFVIIANPFAISLRKLQNAVIKELYKTGFNSEEDIVKLCREIRSENGIL
jgi:AbrB family looped-hinge helix DNA binding protein